MDGVIWTYNQKLAQSGIEELKKMKLVPQDR